MGVGDLNSGSHACDALSHALRSVSVFKRGVYVFASHLDTCGGQKGMPDPLKLEFQPLECLTCYLSAVSKL